MELVKRSDKSKKDRGEGSLETLERDVLKGHERREKEEMKYFFNKTTRMEGITIPIMSTKYDCTLAKLLRKLLHVIGGTLEAIVLEGILRRILRWWVSKVVSNLD